METGKSTYVVMVTNQNPPQKHHETYESALEEANRLIRKEKRVVYILKAITRLELIEPVITELE